MGAARKKITEAEKGRQIRGNSSSIEEKAESKRGEISERKGDIEMERKEKWNIEVQN